MKSVSGLKFYSVVTLTLFLFSGVAGAESFDSLKTATADITFTAPASPLSLTITSDNPTAGIRNDREKVAAFKIISTSAVRIGERFTPSAGVVGSSENTMTFKGKNVSNQITLEALAPSGGSHTTIGANKFYVSDNPVTDWSGSIVLKGNQSIAADTYTVSMDAVVYNP